jgi:AraC family transcriptional regulator
MQLESGRFLGESLRERTLANVAMQEGLYAPGLRLGKHSHQTAFFSLLLEGGYEEHYTRRTQTYEPLSVVFHPKDEEHRVDFGCLPGRCLNIEVSDSLLDLCGSYGVSPQAYAQSGGRLVWAAAEVYREFNAPDDVTPLSVQALVMEMLALVERSSRETGTGAPPWMRRIDELMRTQFRERLTVTEMAREAGVHPVHLSRVFRRLHGCGPGEFQRNLRIEYACRRLHDRRSPLAEIALDSGFADQTHFTRAFRRVTGTTPAAFRARLS